MYRVFLHVFIVIAACTPLILLVFDMLQRYPLDTVLTDIGFIDAILLIVAIGLPVFALSRLGVDWRTEPEDYQGKPGK
ncbi:MAG: hypothetical protein JSU67_15360 [Gammaproteobacteria bacterium]|nr:MAG: hypothetical protein EP300_09190 [Gammaproteobacteria bacterium]UCH39517.1 MAG: hypothetical protein JSU67_15360 [Gammaproteobacteria bacterium]